MRRFLIMSSFLFVSVSCPAYAADIITGASPSVQSTGTNARIWITGRGFLPGATVMVSGPGITQTEAAQVVPEAQRVDGGRGDGIIYGFDIAADAPIGARNITVTDANGTATGTGFIQIVQGGAPQQNGNMQPGQGNMQPAQGNNGPGIVDRVTRASPPYAVQGQQVNLWVVGRGFAPGAQVSFSIPGIQPYIDANGQPIANKVFPNAESEMGTSDGLQTFIQVGVPPETPAGLVDVTVTNPNGSSATGRGLIEIVQPGQEPRPMPGMGNIDAITGASPRAAFVGRPVALWLWGEGIAEGAQVAFDNPGITTFSPSSVVERSLSHPGYSGIRNFLQVSPNAQPGPVTVTITNPNGSSQTMPALFELLPSDGAPPGGQEEYQGECPDQVTSVANILDVEPKRWFRDSSITLVISGEAFACGAQIVIPGGGLRASSRPRFYRNPANPFETRLEWDIEIGPNARLGARDITVINPNNTSKTASNAVSIENNPDSDEVRCDQSGHHSTPGPLALFIVVSSLLYPLRRRFRS
ncbi:MAG: hypothetical protein ACON3Z_07490 [Bradymonadia bacterium]